MKKIKFISFSYKETCPECGSSQCYSDGVFYYCNNCGMKWLDEGPDY